MPAQDNAALVRTAYEAFNERDLNRAAALAAEEMEWLNVATGETLLRPGDGRRLTSSKSSGTCARQDSGILERRGPDGLIQ